VGFVVQVALLIGVGQGLRFVKGSGLRMVGEVVSDVVVELAHILVYAVLDTPVRDVGQKLPELHGEGRYTVTALAEVLHVTESLGAGVRQAQELQHGTFEGCPGGEVGMLAVGAVTELAPPLGDRAAEMQGCKGDGFRVVERPLGLVEVTLDLEDPGEGVLGVSAGE
jgi:hypothetical protein